MSETIKVHGSGRHRPKLITKVANGTANLGQYTDKDDISQPRTVHGQRRHKPTREVTRSDHSKRLSEIKAP